MTANVQCRLVVPRAWRAAALLAGSAVLLLTACSDRDPVSAAPRASRASLVDERGNSRLIVGIDDRAVHVLEVEITGDGLREPLAARFERAGDADLFGTVAVPAGEGRRVAMRGSDLEGRKLYAGETALTIERDVTPQLRFDLQPLDRERAEGTQGWIGSYRLAISPGTLGRPSEEPLALVVTVHDPDGARMPIGPDDLAWDWPREIGELEIVYSGREAFEASATWRWVDPRLDDGPDFELVVCDRPRGLCTPLEWNPFAFPRYLKIDGGGRHTCAINSASHALCWGDNSRGQLGIDNGTNLVSSRVWTDISAGLEHTCALDVQGHAWCWGNNGHEQLGRLATPSDLGGPKPTQVSTTHQFTQIAAGGFHTCALDTAGQIWCWGKWTLGQLGDNTFHVHGGDEQPNLVKGGFTWTAVSAGLNHSCGITANGGVRCWGDNRAGQTMELWAVGDMCDNGTGVVDKECSQDPGPSRVSGAIALSSGGNRNCALVNGGAIYCWGAATIGDGTSTDNFQPQQVAGGHTFVAVGVGDRHSCGAAVGGQVWCWGRGGFGQRGDGTFTFLELQPVPAVGASPLAESLGLGDNHSCAVAPGRATLLCWGDGTSGQLGTGGFSPTNVPQQVTVF